MWGLVYTSTNLQNSFFHHAFWQGKFKTGILIHGLGTSNGEEIYLLSSFNLHDFPRV